MTQHIRNIAFSLALGVVIAGSVALVSVRLSAAAATATGSASTTQTTQPSTEPKTSSIVTAGQSLMTQVASGASTAQTAGSGDDVTLLDDALPDALARIVGDIAAIDKQANEYVKHRKKLVDELQKWRAKLEQKLTKAQTRLTQLATEIPNDASAVQKMIANTQTSGADFQTATTKLYAAVALQERLKLRVQKYTTALKKIDDAKVATTSIAGLIFGSDSSDQATQANLTTTGSINSTIRNLSGNSSSVRTSSSSPVGAGTSGVIVAGASASTPASATPATPAGSSTTTTDSATTSSASAA